MEKASGGTLESSGPVGTSRFVRLQRHESKTLFEQRKLGLPGTRENLDGTDGLDTGSVLDYRNILYKIS